MFGFNQDKNAPANLEPHPKKVKKLTVSTFKYKHLDKQGEALNELRKFLVVNNLVNGSKGIKVFKPIFSGVELTESTEKVEWIGRNNALAYFIRTLIKDELIRCNDKQHWDITVKVFVDIKGNVFDRQQFRNSHSLSSDVKVLIDEAISKLKVNTTR